MFKYFLLLVLFSVFGSSLLADPIQNLVITSLTGFSLGVGSAVSFFASGPSVFIEGKQGSVHPPAPWPVGTPIGTVEVSLPSSGGVLPLMLDGQIGTPGNFTKVQLEGGATVSGTTSLLAPDSNTIVTFPGVVTGAYSAFTCGASESPQNCTGPPIANISLNVPVILTLTWASASLPIGENQPQRIDFVSVPEPSSAVLFFLGGVLLLGCSTFEEHAQNGRDIKRAARRASEFPPYLAACIRALCAPLRPRLG